MENLGTLRVVNLSLGQLKSGMLDALRFNQRHQMDSVGGSEHAARYGTVTRKQWYLRAAGGLGLAGAALTAAGLFYNSILVWGGLLMILGTAPDRCYAESDSHMNPLLEISFRVPFDQIQASAGRTGHRRTAGRCRRRLEETIASPEPLHALDTMTERLEYAMNVVRHLESVATTPELRAAFNAVQPKVSVFYSSLPLNEDLWKAIQRYAATAEGKSLTGAMKRYLTKTIDSFKRHGADLPAEGKARLKEIDVALTEATTKFSENVLDSTNAYELLIDGGE